MDIDNFFFFLSTAGSKEAEIKLWNERLGHISNTTIWKMFREKAADGLNLTTRSDTPPPLCADCMKGKMTRLPFPSDRNRANDIGQLIHSECMWTHASYLTSRSTLLRDF